jgi:hypothetical protein
MCVYSEAPDPLNPEDRPWPTSRAGGSPDAVDRIVVTRLAIAGVIDSHVRLRIRAQSRLVDLKENPTVWPASLADATRGSVAHRNVDRLQAGQEPQSRRGARITDLWIWRFDKQGKQPFVADQRTHAIDLRRSVRRPENRAATVTAGRCYLADLRYLSGRRERALKAMQAAVRIAANGRRNPHQRVRTKLT